MSTKASGTRKSSKSGKTTTVTFPESMWELLNIIGNKLYTPARAGKRSLSSKYARTICMVLSDNNEKQAAELMKLAEVAYRDFARLSGDLVRFAP
jgi:hypothetical protein